MRKIFERGLLLCFFVDNEYQSDNVGTMIFFIDFLWLHDDFLLSTFISNLHPHKFEISAIPIVILYINFSLKQILMIACNE